MSLTKHINLPRKVMVLTLAALAVLSFGLMAPANG